MFNPEMSAVRGDAEEKDVKKHSRFKRHLTSLILSAAMAIGMAENSNAQEKGLHDTGATAGEADAIAEKIEAHNRKSFEDFREVVISHDLHKKISKLRETFGGSIDTFLQIHRISRDLDSLASLERNIDNPEAFVKKSSPYMVTFGSIVSNAYEERWQRYPDQKQELQLNGLDAIPGFDTSAFLENARKTYPSAYLEGSISSVQFVPKTETRGNLQILGEAETFSIDKLMKSGDDLRSAIVIYETGEGTTTSEFNDIFAHEVHHPNDWLNSRILTSAERISMLADISERIIAEDRFRSEYVENITAKDVLEVRSKNTLPENTTIEQLTLYVRTLEYWAEIAKQYFSDSSGFRNTNEKDWAIVDKWVRIIGAEV